MFLCDYVKNRIGTCKKCLFWFEKGYKQIIALDSPKTYCLCNSKKLKFIKEQKARGLLSNLGIRTSLSQIPLLGCGLFQNYKTNEIINKFLLAGDNFIPEMHLKQQGFRYNACGPFTKKKKKRIKELKGIKKKRQEKFKETGDSRYIYQIKQDKAYFQHDVAYGDFKDLNRRTIIKYYLYYIRIKYYMIKHLILLKI